MTADTLTADRGVGVCARSLTHVGVRSLPCSSPCARTAMAPAASGTATRQDAR